MGKSNVSVPKGEAMASSTSKNTSSFGLVLGGKLKLKGESKKKKRKQRSEEDQVQSEDDDFELPEYSADPVVGSGKLTSSGVVIMGVDTNFTAELSIGDTLMVTVVDSYRNTETQESRLVNMVLGKASLNLEAPFTCDITRPTIFMFVKKAPDLAALKAARAEERQRTKRVMAESKEVTYKVLKQGCSGGASKWLTVTEKVKTGMTREEMLLKRVEKKADRFC